jgi:hypothetical protein
MENQRRRKGSILGSLGWRFGGREYLGTADELDPTQGKRDAAGVCISI